MVQLTKTFGTFLAGRCAAMSTLEPGVATPRSFTDARSEHLATRRSAGLFDFSFMSCAEITGANGGSFLKALQTRSLDHLPPGRIAYTLLLREDGTVLTDATVWRISPDRYWLFVGRRSDFEYVSGHAAQSGVAVAELASRHAVMAIQGTASLSIIERCFAPHPIAPVPYFGFLRIPCAGADCWLARLGYSGEAGYELVIDDAAAPALWNALLEAGAGRGLVECGFAAADSLRIEAGHILFSRELATPVTPAEIGLARLVDFYRPAFRGGQAVRSQRWRPPQRRLVGLLPAADGVEAFKLPTTLTPNAAVITSTCWSPLLERTIGIGFVNSEDAHPGARITLGCGMRAQVARLPFYDPGRRLPRRLR